MTTVFSIPHRGKRKEALVQGGHLYPYSSSLCKLTALQDMHYAEFAEDEVRSGGPDSTDGSSVLTWRQSAALLAAIKEYEASKWKVIGQKLGKPAKVSSRAMS